MLDIPEKQRVKMQWQQLLQTREIVHIRETLLKAGLRATRQRLIIAQTLLCGPHQHISADALHLTLSYSGFGLSLATVYNSLNQFADAGLIRKISVSGQRTFFDTNVHNHQHYYLEDEDRMIDIIGELPELMPPPQAPYGYRISKIDILVSLQKIENTSNMQNTKRKR